MAEFDRNAFEALVQNRNSRHRAAKAAEADNERLRALAAFAACLEDCEIWDPDLGKCSCGYIDARAAVNSSVCEAFDGGSKSG